MHSFDGVLNAQPAQKVKRLGRRAAVRGHGSAMSAPLRMSQSLTGERLSSWPQEGGRLLLKTMRWPLAEGANVR